MKKRRSGECLRVGKILIKHIEIKLIYNWTRQTVNYKFEDRQFNICNFHLSGSCKCLISSSSIVNDILTVNIIGIIQVKINTGNECFGLSVYI